MYKEVKHCASCDHILSLDDRVNNGCTCPYCGAKGSLGVTVDYVIRSVEVEDIEEFEFNINYGHIAWFITGFILGCLI